MVNHNNEPVDHRAALELAIGQFMADMLADDDFFALVAKRLEADPQWRCEDYPN